MTTPDEPDFTPAPGTARCTLCNAVKDADHVRHPPGQIIDWLWRSSPTWRLVLTAATLLTVLIIIKITLMIRGVL